MRTKNLLVAVLFLIAVQILMQACSSNQQAQSDKDKIETLIASMTLEEKIGMIVGDGKFLPAGINKSPAPEGATEYTYTTAFPTSTCLAATWNTTMILYSCRH